METTAVLISLALKSQTKDTPESLKHKHENFRFERSVPCSLTYYDEYSLGANKHWTYDNRGKKKNKRRVHFQSPDFLTVGRHQSVKEKGDSMKRLAKNNAARFSKYVSNKMNTL